jgi:hypothetical protein
MSKEEAPVPPAGPAPAALSPDVAMAALEFLGRARIPVLMSEAEALLRVRMALEAVARNAG